MCSKSFDANQLINMCPTCQRPLLARYDLNRAKETLTPEALRERTHTTGSLWRYEEVLPIQQKDHMLSLGEGWTMLHHAKRLGKHIGCPNTYIKDEGTNNATGSFKARGLSVAVSRAYELGAPAVSVPSAGNAAGATSAYAAAAGLQAHVYMPQDVPLVFRVECEQLGAHVTLVDGLINDCGKRAKEDAKQSSVLRFDLSTLKEPYRLEGKKTMGYELAEQLDWNLPDVIIYPTGGGTGLGECRVPRCHASEFSKYTHNVFLQLECGKPFRKWKRWDCLTASDLGWSPFKVRDVHRSFGPFKMVRSTRNCGMTQKLALMVSVSLSQWETF